MPSQRKRIGFLPSEEVKNIIDKICIANQFSQSKVTGLLVEEALRYRGELSDSLGPITDRKSDIINDSSEQESLPNNKSLSNSEDYKINTNSFSDNVKMMHEFIEFKYFKKVINQNKNFFK